MFDQASGLDQPGGLERLAADKQARRKAKTFRQCIRLGFHRAGDAELDVAEQQFVADRKPEPIEKQWRCDRTIGAALARKQCCKRIVRLGHELAIERVGVIDSLDLDQRLIGPVGLAGHRAQAGRHRNGAEAFEETDFLRRGFAVVEFEADVAGQQFLSLRGDRIGDRLRNGIDGGNGAGAERDAGKEDVEAPDAAAQLAQRQAKSERDAWGDDPHAIAASLRRAALSPSIRRSGRESGASIGLRARRRG